MCCQGKLEAAAECGCREGGYCRDREILDRGEGAAEGGEEVGGAGVAC